MNDVLILCYHAVSESWPASISVTPAALERQLGAIARRGYRGTTFFDAVTGMPAAKTVAITFDDAFRSVLELASPILSRFGYPGTVFVPTAYPGSEQPMAWPGMDTWVGGPHERELTAMSWAELRQLADAGWEIGAHTRTHPRLPELDDAAVAAELRGARADCEREVGVICRSLAYPYGDHDARVAAIAKDAGYEAACGVRPLAPEVDRLRRSRVGVYHRDGRVRFRLKASAPLRRLARWSVAGRVD